MRDRIVALIDMDCFYVQVEQRAEPEYWGKPCAVAQYNPWRGGGIIAVGYEARAFGVKRGFRGDDAKAVCPDIHMFMVEEERGKANLGKYRKASTEVMDVISSFNPLITIERASIDEAFLDLTNYVDEISMKPSWEEIEGSRIAGLSDVGFQGKDLNEIEAAKLKHFYDNADSGSEEERLLIGASAIKQIRAAILQETQFKCSAGISHNKTLSKLAAGMNKPNCQTILAYSGVPKVYENTKIDKVRNLGGKLGDELKSKLGITTMGQLAAIPKTHLTSLFMGKTLNWLINLREGIDDEAVVARQIPKSIGCGKNFPGKGCLSTSQQVTHWFGQLCSELVERLEEDRKRNNRSAKLLTVHVKFNVNGHVSKSLPMYDMDSTRMVEYVNKHVLSKFIHEDGVNMIDPIVRASVTASKFVDADLCWKNAKIDNYFSKVDKPQPSTSTTTIERVTNGSTINGQSNVNNSESTSVINNHPTESNGSAAESNDSTEINQFIPTTSRVGRITVKRSNNREVESDNNQNETQLLTMFARISDQNEEEESENWLQPTVRRGFFYRKTLELKRKRRLEQNNRPTRESKRLNNS